MTPNQNEVLLSYVKRNNKLIEDIQSLERRIEYVKDQNRNGNSDMEDLFVSIMKHRRSDIRIILLKEAELILNTLKQKLEETSLLQILSEAEKLK